MEIHKVKVTLLTLPDSEPGTLPYPQEARITDEAGNDIVCYWPIDIHIGPDGCYVTLRLNAEVEIEGQQSSFEDSVVRAVKKAQAEKKL